VIMLRLNCVCAIPQVSIDIDVKSADESIPWSYQHGRHALTSTRTYCVGHSISPKSAKQAAYNENYHVCTGSQGLINDKHLVFNKYAQTTS
jgi:hypothetical protein